MRTARSPPCATGRSLAIRTRCGGRLLYNPETDPTVWRRLLWRQYRNAAPALEAALGHATRILPLVTTAHLPSAAHDTYSPEFYTNQSMADPKAPSPYGDTPEPKVFGTVSPLDPELFGTIVACADECLAGRRGGRYAPLDAAVWLDQLAGAAESALADAKQAVAVATSAEWRRAAIDIRMQIGMGRFFAAKLRSGVLYSIHEKTGDRRALEEAMTLYRRARSAWAAFADEAKAVYVADITFGPLAHQRGHWADRVGAMDTDIALLEKKLAAPADHHTVGARRR